jgi:hypothetical protein
VRLSGTAGREKNYDRPATAPTAAQAALRLEAAISLNIAVPAALSIPAQQIQRHAITGRVRPAALPGALTRPGLNSKNRRPHRGLPQTLGEPGHLDTQQA